MALAMLIVQKQELLTKTENENIRENRITELCNVVVVYKRV